MGNLIQLFLNCAVERWMAMAVEIARDLVNQSGGAPGGRTITLVKADIPNPTAATSEASRLVAQEKLQVLLGTFAAPLGVAVSAVAAKEAVVHWEIMAAADILTKRNSKWIFRNGLAAGRYGAGAVDMAAELIAPKLGAAARSLRVGTLWENRPWGTGTGEGVRARAKELGLPLALDESYDQFATDMTPIVQKVKDATLDVLIAASYYNDAVLFQKKARELNLYLKALVGLSAGYAIPEFGQVMGKAANGIFDVETPPRVGREALRPETARLADFFYDAYRKKTGHEPAGHAVASFAAAHLLFHDVLRAAKGMQAEDIRAAAVMLDKPPGYQINGWGVKYSQFDQPGDPKDAGQNLRSFVVAWQWQDGHPVTVWPKRFAQREPILVPLSPWEKR